MLVDLIKGLFWLWPFISEMFFGGKPFKTIVKDNKFTTTVIVVLLFSLILNYLVLSKLFRISEEVSKKNIPVIEQKQDKKDHWVGKELEEIYNDQ